MNKILNKKLFSTILHKSVKTTQKPLYLSLANNSSIVRPQKSYQIRRFHGDNKDCTHDHDHADHKNCDHDHDHKDEHSVEKVKISKETKEQLQMFDDFKEGLDYEKKGNKIAALDRFNRVKDILKSVNQEKSYNYIYVLKKIAFLNQDMYQYADAETAFNSCLDTAQEITNNPQIIHTHYHNLFCFYMRANLKSAILMGKALMSEEEKDDIPQVFQKQYLFNLGTAYLLNGNYSDSKKVLRSCLNMDPKGSLKARCLNNLAVSYWWHKVPNSDLVENKDNEEVNKNYSPEDMEKEFNLVIAQLKKSIEANEIANPDFGMRDDKEKVRFVELTMESETVPTNPDQWLSYAKPNEKLLQNPASIQAVLNLVEFIMATGKESKDATFWLKIGLTIAESLPPLDKAKLLMYIGHLSASNNEIIKAEGLFLTCEDLLKHIVCYERVHLCNIFADLLDGIDNRKGDAALKIETANKITKFLPYWSPRMMSVQVPDFL